MFQNQSYYSRRRASQKFVIPDALANLGGWKSSVFAFDFIVLSRF